ncbi:hypothetical protein Cni_G27935 [Canna indica]|uniref:Uncharacterized protein n=1 Tax=Canna indica TaxID=4628 RepID=A0AAQ3QRT1_9LILI|nr:hypothetical protein Cni_G27935 [Canna indica]
MAEWYMASCQFSIALISLRSTLAFSAVSLDLSSSAALFASMAAAGSADSGSTSRGIGRNSGAHQGRFAFGPPGEASATIRMEAATGRSRIFAGGVIGKEEMAAAMRGGRGIAWIAEAIEGRGRKERHDAGAPTDPLSAAAAAAALRACSDKNNSGERVQQRRLPVIILAFFLLCAQHATLSQEGKEEEEVIAVSEST